MDAVPNSMQPLMMRQRSERGLEEVKSRSIWFVAIFGAIMLAPGIACLVVATNDSADECDGSYTVDLITFLEVAGGLQVGFGGLAICCGICAIMNDMPAAVTNGNGCVGLFYLIWAAIGLYMWDNQMSYDCQDTAVAEMVLAWSVIQYAMIPVICCCVCFMACMLGTVMAAVGMQEVKDAMDDEDNRAAAEPLVDEKENEVV